MALIAFAAVAALRLELITSQMMMCRCLLLQPPTA